MSVKAKAVIITSATVAVPGTSVAPAIPIPDNCHTIMVRNISVNDGLFGSEVPGTALVAGTNAAVLDTNESISIPIGTSAQRGTMDASVIAPNGIVYDSPVAGTVFSIMYLCYLVDPQ